MVDPVLRVPQVPVTCQPPNKHQDDSEKTRGSLQKKQSKNVTSMSSSYRYLIPLRRRNTITRSVLAPVTSRFISKTVHVLWDVCGAVVIAQHPPAQTLPPWPQHDHSTTASAHSTTASAHSTTVACLSDPFLYRWGAGIHVIGWDSKNSFIACKLQ